jgi:uncharacterized membrane protein
MFIANVAVTLVSLAVLPERVATHFGAGGMADGWASNQVNALITTGVHVILFCCFYFTDRLIFLFPPSLVNLPNKEYWLDPANKPRTIEKIQGLMWNLGAVMFLFLLVLGLLALQANLAKTVRLNEPVFFAALGALLVYTIGWLVVFYRTFRIPGNNNGANRQAGRRPGLV